MLLPIVVGCLLLAALPASARPKGEPGLDCTFEQLSSPGALRCVERGNADLINGVPNPHIVICLANGTRACCQKQSDGGYSCGYITDIGLNPAWWPGRPGWRRRRN